VHPLGSNYTDISRCTVNKTLEVSGIPNGLNYSVIRMIFKCVRGPHNTNWQEGCGPRIEDP